MIHGSLFSGIGGFDLAAEWAGWQNIFNCEWEEFPRKVLKHHFSNAKQYGDIREFNATDYAGRIDILSGGFPCQPYSVAGKQLGKEDERHLWPEMLRVIRECSPRWVVGENVRGLVNWSGGLVFEEVCVDLEACGYSVQPFILPAAGVNAPHRRDRVWFVAKNTLRVGCVHGEFEQEETEFRKQRNVSARSCDGFRVQKRITPDTKHNGQPTAKGRRSDGEDSQRSKEGQEDAKQFEGIRKPEKLGSVYTPDTDDEGLQGCEEQRGFGGSRKKRNKHPPGRIYTEWENFPTQPPVCGRNDGIPKELDGITFPKWRTESIKAYGNAIVPQVAYQIFQAINQYENDQP
jgi:DNA (cytosine-5)-methyltransferase 1